MGGTLIRGSYVVIDPDTILKSGAIYIDSGHVVEVGKYDYLKKKYSQANEIGDSNHLVLPGFINAHGHGKGISDFQRGQIDNTLETWKFRSYPHFPVHLDTLWQSIKLLEAGVTTTMHNHMPVHPEEYVAEFESILDAYKKARLNVAFAPNLSERNHFVYGDNEAFINSLPVDLSRVCREFIAKGEKYGRKQYFDAIDKLLKGKEEKKKRIMHGPLSPQWVNEETLREIRTHASANNLRIHIHTQQTQLQYLYGYRAYGKSLIAYLAETGFLRDDVTLGHAVWISEDDINLLAETGASTTHHATCNLRVRNGISPVYEMMKRGVKVAVGMDDKEFGDNKDFIEEMRLISKLHRLPSHRLDSPHMMPKDVFQMGTKNGAEVLGFSGEIGSLHPGNRADMVFIDLSRSIEPFVHPDHNPIDLFLYRCGTMDIDMVLVDGEKVVEKGRVLHLDREEIVKKLRESVPKDYKEQFSSSNRKWQKLRPYIADWFEPWYKEMGKYAVNPYYHFNDKLTSTDI